MMLQEQPYLCDLHTHLMGMGNTGFWIGNIIESHEILPTHVQFLNNPELREKLCPLVWNKLKKEDGAFIDGQLTAKFFYSLITNNFPKCTVKHILESLDSTDAIALSQFQRLIDNNEFIRLLDHHDLSFGRYTENGDAQMDTDGDEQERVEDFTYDVVLTLSDLGKSLGVTKPGMDEFEDLIQSKVEEKLGLHTYQPSTDDRPLRPFRQWIVFNAREQVFQVVKGITVETLRKLISVKPNATEQACALARAHIHNAFSMCNPDGTDPRPIDFDRFHGSFTPEFYPRRFVLKDSLYSQRLDILAALLVHVLVRYQTSLPPIRYCELSVGVGDLSRPHIFDVLCSFPAYEQFENEQQSTRITSFRTMIEQGKFPHLRNACPKQDKSKNPRKSKSLCVPNVTYKFLAGFNRQTVVAHRLNNQVEALRLLNDSPDVAIHYMLEQIVKSENYEEFDTRHKSSQVFMNNEKHFENHTLSQFFLTMKFLKYLL
jgi:hypothetical protein